MLLYPLRIVSKVLIWYICWESTQLDKLKQVREKITKIKTLNSSTFLMG